MKICIINLKNISRHSHHTCIEPAKIASENIGSFTILLPNHGKIEKKEKLKQSKLYFLSSSSQN
jgi:hypothetical protein